MVGETIFTVGPPAALTAGYFIWRRLRAGMEITRFSLALLTGAAIPLLMAESFALGRSQVLQDKGCHSEREATQSSESGNTTDLAVQDAGTGKTEPSHEKSPRQDVAEIAVPRFAIVESEDGEAAKQRHANLSNRLHIIPPAGLDSHRMAEAGGVHNLAGGGAA